jgi:hypothetical protein
MRSLLLICWIASLGITRVDLLGGRGGFVLTPFLVLSALVVAFEVGHVVSRGGWFRIPPRMPTYFLCVCALLSVITASAFLSFEMATSLRRVALLVVQVVAVLLVAVAFANHESPHRVLVTGAYAGLATSLFFNLVQIVVWVGGISHPIDAWVTLAPGTYAGIIPRLTGASHDPNLGGLLIVAYLFVILRFAAPSRARTVMTALGVLSLPLTISRSALLTAMTVGGVALLQRRGSWVSMRGIFWGSTLVAGIALVLLVTPRMVEGIDALSQVLSQRLTVREGSASEHATVLRRGWEVGTANFKQIVLGIGYGNAYTVLQDIYPGSKYGNFHSLFVTLFAESGVFAALLMIGLVVYPLTLRTPYRPLIVGMIVYNLFQQTPTDPVFWLFLTLAWTGLDRPAEPEPTLSLDDGRAIGGRPSPPAGPHPPAPSPACGRGGDEELATRRG